MAMGGRTARKNANNNKEANKQNEDRNKYMK
jgi:hypothetical protein